MTLHYVLKLTGAVPHHGRLSVVRGSTRERESGEERKTECGE